MYDFESVTLRAAESGYEVCGVTGCITDLNVATDFAKGKLKKVVCLDDCYRFGFDSVGVDLVILQHQQCCDFQLADRRGDDAGGIGGDGIGGFNTDG